MTTRIDLILITRKNITKGGCINVTKNSGKKFSFKGESENNIINGVKAVITAIENTDVNDLDNVVRIHIPSHIYMAINGDLYKFYLLTGKDSKGRKIPEEELEVWKEFADIMQEKGMFFTFRNVKNIILPEYEIDSDRKIEKLLRYAPEKLLLHRYATKVMALLDKACPKEIQGGYDGSVHLA